MICRARNCSGVVRSVGGDEPFKDIVGGHRADGEVVGVPVHHVGKLAVELGGVGFDQSDGAVTGQLPTQLITTPTNPPLLPVDTRLSRPVGDRSQNAATGRSRTRLPQRPAVARMLTLGCCGERPRSHYKTMLCPASFAEHDEGGGRHDSGAVHARNS